MLFKKNEKDIKEILTRTKGEGNLKLFPPSKNSNNVFNLFTKLFKRNLFGKKLNNMSVSHKEICPSNSIFFSRKVVKNPRLPWRKPQQLLNFEANFDDWFIM